MNNKPESPEDQEEKQRLRNKKRLTNQNKKLNVEIRKLQAQINEIITSKDSQQNEGMEGTLKNQSMKKLREQLTMQDGYLRKLKNKIDFLKSANVKGNAQYIIKEEDELRIIKKDYQDLIIEKQTIIRFKQDKLKQLQRNQPFEDHKTKVETTLADVRNENRKMQADITELQREIRKYHNIQTLQKSLNREKGEKIEDVEFQLAKAKHQLSDIRKKTKEVEEKWRPQFQTLDSIYFELKNTFLLKETKIGQIEKQHRMWQTRKSSLREENQLMEYRERLSKINTSEWKMPQMSTVVVRKPKQELENYLIHRNIKPKEDNKDKKNEENNDKNELQIIKQQPQIIDNNKFSQVNTLDSKNKDPKASKDKKETKEVKPGEESPEKNKKKKSKPEQIVMLSNKKENEKDKKNTKQNLKDLVKGPKKELAPLEKKGSKLEEKSPEKSMKNIPKSQTKQSSSKPTPLSKQKTDRQQKAARTQIKSERGAPKKQAKLQKQKSDKQLNAGSKDLKTGNQNKEKGKNKLDTPSNKKGVKMILKNVGIGTA